MNKEVVKKLIKRQSVTQDELVEFLIAYIREEKNVIPTPEQISGILAAFQFGFFKMDFVLNRLIQKYNFKVTTLVDKNGSVLQINVEEDA